MKFKLTFLILSTLFVLNSSGQSSYYYQQEFNSKGSFVTGNNSNRELKVSNGRYYFTQKNKKSSDYVTSKSIYLDRNKDFEMETSIQKISGEQNYGIGFIYDYKDDENYSEFDFSPNGYIRVAEVRNNKFNALKKWTKNSKVKTGNYAVNKLRVKKKGSWITFYINDSYAYSTSTASFIGKKIGIIIHRKQKVSIDYFRVKYLNSTTTTTTKSKSIIFEGFTNNKRGWSTTNTDKASLSIENGDYIFEHKRTSNGWSSTKEIKIDTRRDFYILASFKKLSGIQANGYGLSFGRKDSSDEFNFVVTGNGSYGIWDWKDSKSSNMTSSNKTWVDSDAIKTGNNAYNTLKIEKKGNKLNFYINSTLVESSPFRDFYGDRLGFVVYKQQKVAVNYLSAMYIGDNITTTKKKTSVKKSILFEGFTDNKRDWSTSDNEKATLAIRNGDYIFEHKRTYNGWSSTKEIKIDTKRDFYILASFKKLSGIQVNGYGLSFGRKDSDDEFNYVITGNGSYGIWDWKNGKSSNMTSRNETWVDSDAIKTGNNAYNTLKIEKKGSKLNFYINSTLVESTYFRNFYGDRLGFVVYKQQKIAINYLSLMYLDDRNSDTDTYVDTTKDNISNYTYSDNGFHYSEQFNNNLKKWDTSSDDKIDYKVANGKYYIEHKRTTKGYSTYNDVYVDTNKDFEIETKIDKISGVTNYAYGLMWGKKAGNSFRFYISSGGYYKIARNVNSKEQIIKKWTKTSYVNTGNGKSNVLKVKKESDKYKFYINGNYVSESDYESFYGEDMGYVVFNRQKIGVDYLRIKYLNTTSPVVTNRTLQVPLYDSFSSNTNSWYLTSTEKQSTTMTNGKLVIHRKEKGGTFVSRHANIDTSRDFIIETSIAKEIESATGMYGFTFGRKNSSNEYSFLLSDVGSYKFRKFDHDKYATIIPFTTSSYIKSGAHQYNKIKIVKSGGLLRFYINNQYVNETKFEGFFGDYLGFTAYHNQKISVDYLDIKYQSNSYNNPPVIVITEPDVKLKRGFKIVKTKRIMVKGRATDADGIFEILINGVDATVSADGSFYANVPLKFGENDLIVKATDIKQASSTKTFTITRESPVIKDDIVIKDDDKPNIGFGKYYALIIGVSDYGNENLQDLAGHPTKDATDLANILKTKYNFKQENITLLNSSPTANQIKRGFANLRKRVTNKDNVLIFYAGHGDYDQDSETGNWLPSDANPEFFENVITNAELKVYIKQIKSKHTLLIADACFSGSILKKTRAGNLNTAPKSIKKNYDLMSRKAMTSGTLKQVPNKSVFLKYLIKRLSDNQKKYITSMQLFNSLSTPVANNSENLPQFGTVFGVGDEGGDFIFIKN
ncbi:MAG: caspase family protein [Flavobacteriaceae bacterium]